MDAMDNGIYKVTRIDGEYAYIQNLEKTDEEPLFIAMALLPSGVDIGDTLRFENFEFSLCV